MQGDGRWELNRRALGVWVAIARGLEGLRPIIVDWYYTCATSELVTTRIREREVIRGSFANDRDFNEAGDAERRIWADLKYRDDRPVLQHMELISKPSKRVMMDIKELRLLCSGRGAKQVKPLGFGEVAVVHTKNKEHEWLEAREALQMKLAGEIVCRAR
ncbi:hypothetical protein HWV62_43018 [Athelia sp. TMB]|nr:hypothetical protein HWV62_43018 [Athelia sp. TMB]